MTYLDLLAGLSAFLVLLGTGGAIVDRMHRPDPRRQAHRVR